MEFELVKHSHTIGESNYHFLFTPAYRKKIFEIPKVRKLVGLFLRAICGDLKVIVVAVNFGPDHAHVFLSNCKNYTVPVLAQRIKGFISRYMRKHHRHLFRHLLWGDKFWTGGYFYRSVGAVTGESVKYYIEHSQVKHWKVVDYEFYKYSVQKQLSQF